MDTNTLTALSEQMAAPSTRRALGRSGPRPTAADQRRRLRQDIVLTNARALGRDDGIKVTSADGRTPTASLRDGIRRPDWRPSVEGLEPDSRTVAESPRASGTSRCRRALVEQRADRERRHRRRYRRTAADRTRARDRADHPGHGPDARRVRWRRRDRRGGPSHGHRHGRADPRPGSRYSSGDRVEERRARARARPAQNRLPGHLRSGRAPARAAARRRADAIARCWSSTSPRRASRRGRSPPRRPHPRLRQQPVGSTDDLLALLNDRVGRDVALRVLRGGAATDLTVTIGIGRASN